MGTFFVFWGLSMKGGGGGLKFSLSPEHYYIFFPKFPIVISGNYDVIQVLMDHSGVLQVW